MYSYTLQGTRLKIAGPITNTSGRKRQLTLTDAAQRDTKSGVAPALFCFVSASELHSSIYILLLYEMKKLTRGQLLSTYLTDKLI
jgi:hypothetical protein